MFRDKRWARIQALKKRENKTRAVPGYSSSGDSQPRRERLRVFHSTGAGARELRTSRPLGADDIVGSNSCNIILKIIWRTSYSTDHFLRSKGGLLFSVKNFERYDMTENRVAFFLRMQQDINGNTSVPSTELNKCNRESMNVYLYQAKHWTNATENQ
ncbi:hypothetical protein CEXT_360041 [Caerostris extrusa]|uniref:Uncharacterized protein n=1 Tax=Caerostris extrusa TaxID=172846 RepID=A0AAV4YCR9_CAEEX|nr:hypothetical protein CEXT_360041 [Caerostris extrusa]